MAIRILIKERKELLNEISYEDALATFGSKKYIKQLANIVRNTDIADLIPEDDVKKIAQRAVEPIRQYIQEFELDQVDITEPQKGLSVLWLKKVIPTKDNILAFSELNHKPKGRKTRSGWFTDRWGELYRDRHNLKVQLERFFQMQDFIEPQEKKDLNKVEDAGKLFDLVQRARPRYQAYLDKKSYENAGEGKEKLAETDRWMVFAAHNKGAACELGKGTDWCTAAPGLDYFGQYYSEDDPLFIFINKKNPEEKYQFHYGKKQFMDKNDNWMGYWEYIFLHVLLLEHNIDKKYPTIVMNQLNFDSSEGWEGTPKWRHRITRTPRGVSLNIVDLESGEKKWYMRGELHREDGPAIEPPSGYDQWYLNGKQYSESAWERAKERQGLSENKSSGAILINIRR